MALERDARLLTMRFGITTKGISKAHVKVSQCLLHMPQVEICIESCGNYRKGPKARQKLEHVKQSLQYHTISWCFCLRHEAPVQTLEAGLKRFLLGRISVTQQAAEQLHLDALLTLPACLDGQGCHRPGNFLVQNVDIWPHQMMQVSCGFLKAIG